MNQILCSLALLCLSSAQTTGLFFNLHATGGYNLYSTSDGVGTYLVNNHGEILHTWTEPDGLLQSGSSVLTEQGTLLRSAKIPSDLYGAFYNGKIREYDAAGNCLWEFRCATDLYRLHYRFTVLPNRNLLALATSLYPLSQAAERGFTGTADPTLGGFIGENILEIKRGGIPNPLYKASSLSFDGDFDDTCQYISQEDDVVWRWESFQHSSPSPDLGTLNINTRNIFVFIDYLPSRGHILVDNEAANEIMVIDHKSGAILWRWGNPAAYGSTSPQTLFNPTGVEWVKDAYGWKYNEEEVSVSVSSMADPASVPGSSFLVLTPEYKDGAYVKLNELDYSPSKERRKITSRLQYNGDSRFFDYYQTTVQLDIGTFYPIGQVLPNGHVVMSLMQSGTLIELNKENYEIWRFVSPGFAADGGIYGPKPPDVIVPKDGQLTQCNLFLCNGMMKSTRYSQDFGGIQQVLCAD